MDINTVRNALKIAGFASAEPLDPESKNYGFICATGAKGTIVIDYRGSNDHRQTMLNGYVAALLAVGDEHEVFQVRMTSGKANLRQLIVEPRVLSVRPEDE